MGRARGGKNSAVQTRASGAAADERILVIGDLHIADKRAGAFLVAKNSILSKLSGIYQEIILLGDIFDKTPTTVERIAFAIFLKELKQFSQNIILIKGTKSHDYAQGEYHLEDLVTLGQIKAYLTHTHRNFIFGHFEVAGAEYSNGFKAQEDNEIDPEKTYILGHIHKPQDYKNIHFVGSVYRTDFSEEKENKRILEIINGELNFIPIASQDMQTYDIKSIAGGRIGVHSIPMDVRLVDTVSSAALPEINAAINSLKNSTEIEYYQEDIRIIEAEVELPKNLNEAELLKGYCESKGIDYVLIKEELP